MGRGTFSRTAFKKVYDSATSGGAQRATHQAEQRIRSGGGFDPLVDPKGLPHHGTPVRPSRPRYTELDNGLFQINIGVPMPDETLLDTTGSMGDNVDLAFAALPACNEMFMDIHEGRYDVHSATANFGDVQDSRVQPLLRTQFEMDIKIAEQMAMLVPGRGGGGNGKEDPQFGLFAAAYLTKARINKYPGMRRYHFTISDEPVQTTVDLGWLKRLFGDEVLTHASSNGWEMGPGSVPDTAKVIKDLKKQAHAFFLLVDGHDSDRASRQWREMYGAAHLVRLPFGTTEHIHYTRAAIVALTEGVYDLQSIGGFLEKHGAEGKVIDEVLRSVSNIPLGAQMEADAFDRMPVAGDIFRSKTDVWPLTPEELAKLDMDVSTAGDDDGDDVSWL